MVLGKEKSLALAGIRTPDRPARSVVTLPHTPSRLLITLKLLTKAELLKTKSTYPSSMVQKYVVVLCFPIRTKMLFVFIFRT